MGKRWVRHPDRCGCERCAVAWESENPQPVFDEVEGPDIMDCGCDRYYGCDCARPAPSIPFRGAAVAID